MAAPIPLRNDFTARDLRKLARKTSDATQARRLLSLAIIYDGGSRTDASNTGGVTLQIIRDWVLRFNKEGPEGLKDKHGGGVPRLLNEDQLQALEDIIEKGPTPAIHTVVRWRLCDLTPWIGKNIASRFQHRVWDEFYGPEAGENSRLAPAIANAMKRPMRLSKKLPCRNSGNSAKRSTRQRHRNLVSGRSPHRSEKQTDTTLGEAGDTP